MKKVILLILTVFLCIEINAMGAAVNKNDNNQTTSILSLPEDALKEVIIQLIKESKNLLELDKNLFNFALTCKEFNNVVKNEQIKKYYIERRNEILQEIKKEIENTNIYNSIDLNSFKNINSIIPYLEDEYTNALIYASKYGHLDLVKLLIENKADLNIKNSNGGTALICAVTNNRIEITELLLNNGADISIKDNLGYTALNYAIIYKFEKIIQLIKEKRKEIFDKGNYKNYDHYNNKYNMCIVL